VRYWDTSALVPLLVADPRTEAIRSLLSEDERIVTWAWTAVEFTSAIERRAREGRLDRAGRRSALARLEQLASAWDEVTDVLAVRRHARALLARHQLRATDAAQLAAALVAAPAERTVFGFVCLDARLSEAAEREGLEPIPAPT
jgi:predicted nucleic acid-binding protein